MHFEIDDVGQLRLLSTTETTVPTDSSVAERVHKKVEHAPHAEGVVSLVQRQGRVILRHEDDNVTSESSTTLKPHIYLQDDDPEFDDMDEEDPDDDLDI